MMHLLTDDMRRNPYPLFEQLRAASPVFAPPGMDLWMLFDYATVKRALNDPDVFSSRAAPPGGQPFDWLIFQDPPRHTRFRAIILKAFTPRSVAGLEPRIRQISRELLDRKIEQGEMDLAVDYSIQLPLMVIAEMIGIPIEDWSRFRVWSEAILALSDFVANPGEEAQKAGVAYRAATTEMREYLTGLLEARKIAPRDDLLTRLVQAEVDGTRLTDEEILGFFQLLLLAGSETTTNLISNAILCFLEYPDQLARVMAAPELLPSAIEEVLRFRSPLQAVFRQTKVDIEVHGQAIPAGKLVLAMVGAANRDPQHFQAPERFDVTRDPNPHLAFGHGLHFCIGAPLARLEGRIAIGDLLERLKGFALSGDEPWQPRPAFHVLGPSRLPIRFERGDRVGG